MILSYLLEENSLMFVIVLYKEFGSMPQITGSFQTWEYWCKRSSTQRSDHKGKRWVGQWRIVSF